MTDDAPDWLPTVEDEVDPEDQQEAIIDSDAYPMRVLAGAGTGKTFTMVRKIEHLIDEQGVSPDRILALTFTTTLPGRCERNSTRNSARQATTSTRTPITRSVTNS